MRGASRRGSDAVDVSLNDFAWPRATMAVLRHPTLPWNERFAPHIALSTTPLAEIRNAGARDRLSLAGQFAAHIAVLQFAGIADVDFDPGEWAVIRKRGSDWRLVRIAARAAEAEASPTALQHVQQFADAVAVPSLDVLRQSWTRAESVFAEVFHRLRNDATADMRWLQHCAAGEILSPGAEALSAMWTGGGPFAAGDVDAFKAYATLDDSARLLVAGTEFPIQRYAALASIDASLAGSSLSPAAVADALVDRFASTRHVIVISGRLDDDSRRVVEILKSGAADAEPAQAERRWIVLSTRLAAQRAIEERLATVSNPRRWLDEFVTSTAYDEYLSRGVLPVDGGGFATTPEPRRSYIAALALLGTRIPRSLAQDFLRQFLFDQPIEELVIDGVTFADAEQFAFSSDEVREHCATHIPAASRPALCRAAASLADALRGGLLLIESGEAERGVALLESVHWSGAGEVVTALGSLPRTTLTPPLARTLASALVDSGRYRDAREIASVLAADDRELLLARCERRSGDYATALMRVERLTTTSFSAQLLRGELLRLSGRTEDARKALAAAKPASDEESARVTYERALLALDSDESGPPAQHYFGQRLATYRALMRGNFEAAAELAAQSVGSARCALERIDACLDRVFASFSTGKWDDTRALALEALAIVDEAQGDRAAAGILFTLTFVEIDDGRWPSAAQHIRRLREYYAATNDEPRLAEIDLLSGYLEFSRGRYADARRLAVSLLDRDDLLSQVREAASLIVDEIDWIEQRQSPLRSTGDSHNRELDDRHRLMRVRRGLGAEPFASSFMTALATWEASSAGIPPGATTRSQKLKLFRSALSLSRQNIARQLAGELSISIAEAPAARSAPDFEMLRTAASADYPFRTETFAGPWSHATRNRLGQWSQDGSRSFDAATLDKVANTLEADWLPCSDREFLFIDGAGSWPEASRQAIAALFRTRAENHRLRRILEQEEPPASARNERVEGVVGESPLMRSVFSLVERIAPRDVPVCVLGESGTGKELVGRAIHRGSQRRSKQFTALNCAALPEALVESELFGHVRGAFTGADRDRAGVIESCDGGTLFLDEIGEMPLTAQAKLLRFLQDGEFRRVGDTTNRTADVRIVSATNRKLEAAVEEGRFREDLYYRIRGVEVVLPPLRERGADIMLLAQHFLARERDRHRAGPQSFSEEVEMLLQSYGWPGNVRELQNTVRGAHAMAGDAREIDLEHLPERLRNVRPARITAGSYQDAVARFRRDLIEKSLAAAAGNQNRAAALLKISRQALAYQIRELGIMVGKAPSRPRV